MGARRGGAGLARLAGGDPGGGELAFALDHSGGREAGEEARDDALDEKQGAGDGEERQRPKAEVEVVEGGKGVAHRRRSRTKARQSA